MTKSRVFHDIVENYRLISTLGSESEMILLSCAKICKGLIMKIEKLMKDNT